MKNQTSHSEPGFWDNLTKMEKTIHRRRVHGWWRALIYWGSLAVNPWDVRLSVWYKVPWALDISDHVIWVSIGHRIQYRVLIVHEEIVHIILDVYDYLLEIFPLTVVAWRRVSCWVIPLPDSADVSCLTHLVQLLQVNGVDVDHAAEGDQDQHDGCRAAHLEKGALGLPLPIDEVLFH